VSWNWRRRRETDAELQRPSFRQARDVKAALWSFAFVVLLGFVIYLIGRSVAPNQTKAHAWYLVLSASLGAFIGFAELVSRYRDEPMRAVSTRPGVLYITLNGAVGACVYGILVRYSKSILPSLSGDLLLTSIVAGFGGMAILRSKFFTLQTAAGEDIPIGADAAITAFLNAADRGVDRNRAVRRIELVREASRRVIDPTAARDFFQVSLAAFQSLPELERESASRDIEAVYKTDYPSRLKVQALCYGILSRTGEETFQVMIDGLVEYLRGTDSLEQQELAQSSQDT